MRTHITVSGVVQGVGFRPFVYNLAAQHALTGYVRNNNSSVEIEVQGSAQAIASFLEQLRHQAPPLSAIEQITAKSADLERETTFEIRASANNISNQQKFVPPDSATCEDCLHELFDVTNRRYKYPFINCTNCGPRFTIILCLPYDRPCTTMNCFKMCTLCQQEYDDPENRRFHAQPNACPICGPSLSFFDATIKTESYYKEEALSFTLQRLRLGQIIAIKGLGGFHLICDATNDSAIQQLRQRKVRARKPFAVMMSNIDMVRKYCKCSEAEAQELTSVRRPIVLLQQLNTCKLPAAITPGIDRLGVMLPYTPLHYLLMADYKGPIVATSANLKEEPIAIDNNEALSRLANIADGFLMHNRKIYSRYDDSVVTCLAGARTTLRRARGFAPLPIKLPFQTNVDVLACGAHLKNTFCFIHKDQAFISQHIGDLENIETYEHFEHTLTTYKSLFGFTPQIVAHDCHPDYLSTALAQEIAADGQCSRFAIQHHHAHIVSCMIEHGLTQPVIGVAFDGLGYGLDGTLWGGELILASLTEFQRLAYFEPVPLPGNSQCIKEPWRMALSYIYASSPSDTSSFAHFTESLTRQYGKSAVNLVIKQIDQQLNAPLTSSCGRLFDAMSALLGVCHEASYEGQAAMELETLARAAFLGSEESSAYPYEISSDQPQFIIKPRPILEAAYLDYLRGTRANIIATKFHHTLAHIILGVCVQAQKFTGINSICLSGGVFQNSLLLGLACKSLSAAGFRVFSPQELPANDGGISLGQAIVALGKAEAITLPK